MDTDALTRLAKLSATARTARLELDDARYSPGDFSHVWLRRPERLFVKDVSDAAETHHMRQEWSAAFEGFLGRIQRDRWINHPADNACASHKLEQVSRAEKYGLLVPETLVTQSREELIHFFELNQGQVIVKPLTGGYLERDNPACDTVIYTNAVSPKDILAFSPFSACPTLFQERIDKTLDVRITVVDDEVHVVSLTAREPDGTQRLDVRRKRMEDVEYDVVDPPKELHARLVDYVRSYNLRFAAIDMAINTDGEWIFFELNPNGQWAWLDLAGVTNISESFIRCFKRCSYF